MAESLRQDWSREEVEAIVSDYLEMLSLELRDIAYSKAEHRRGLQRMIDRSDGSIEFKHQNISAVLLDLDHPYVDGYKPAWNYQRLLYEVVSERVADDRALEAVIAEDIALPGASPVVVDILSRIEDPPELERAGVRKVSEPPQPRRRPKVDYLQLESRNRSLGLAGEQFIVAFERARLLSQGREQLAERIEHVSLIEGDGAGFDIRSFEPDGSDRLLEVKTTAYGKSTPFFLSRNEVHTSRERRKHYHLVRVFSFRKDPRLYSLHGAVDESCRLEAATFIARAGGT